MKNKLVPIINIFLFGFGIASTSLLFAQSESETIKLSNLQSVELINPGENIDMTEPPANISMEEFMLDDCKAFAAEEGVPERQMDSYLDYCVEDLKQEHQQPDFESGYGNSRDTPFMT